MKTELKASQTLANSQTNADQLSAVAATIQNVALLHQSGVFTTRLGRTLEVATGQLLTDLQTALDRLDPVIAEAVS